MGDSARPTAALVEALRPLDVRGTDLLGSLTHQLRTPLTSALGYLELLADGSFGPITPEQADVLRTVEASVRRLSGLVDELDPAVAAPTPERDPARDPGPAPESALRDGAPRDGA